MNKQMTVEMLLRLCIKEYEKGNGDKKIVISDDNEGNGYHGMFYGFSDAVEMDTQLKCFGDSIENMVYDSCSTKAEEIIILG